MPNKGFLDQSQKNNLQRALKESSRSQFAHKNQFCDSLSRKDLIKIGTALFQNLQYFLWIPLLALSILILGNMYCGAAKADLSGYENRLI